MPFFPLHSSSELHSPFPLHPVFKLIKLGCFIRGRTPSSKARHTHTNTHAIFKAGLINPIVHTCTHTYRSPRFSLQTPNPSLSPPPHPPPPSPPNQLFPSLLSHPPLNPTPLTQLWGDTFRQRGRDEEEGEEERSGRRRKRSTPPLCSAATAAGLQKPLMFCKFQISLQRTPILPSAPPSSSTNPPSLFTLVLKQAFLPHSLTPPHPNLPLNAEVKELKALQRRLLIWVNYSLGCACMCQMHVCVRVCTSMTHGPGSGLESGFLRCLSYLWSSSTPSCHFSERGFVSATKVFQTPNAGGTPSSSFVLRQVFESSALPSWLGLCQPL